MALFPQSFIDDLKQQADIVVVVQDYVSLKKLGANYKGLCPFHGERTPSFQVNRDKGFFHCFGCGVGGDVIKFIELHDKVGFADAVRQLAQRFGMPLPELEQSDEQRAGAAERESLLKIHEAAALWFQQQLATPAGARIRKQIADRGITQSTSDALGLGFAPPGRDGLTQALRKQGYTQALLLRAGLTVQRDDGGVVDRFRNRLMIPISRDTGAVIAFGGRAVDPDQQPKYLNSPETPIYSKSRTLYGLNLAKAAIRERGFAVLVEGYFDWAQVYQSGYQAVVASCGTALTSQQAQQLFRFTKRVVLSFDPDAAGQGAAAKSCEMLVAEGFDVNVAILPEGQDPDTYVRAEGAQGYGERLRLSLPYLSFLAQGAAKRHNVRSADGRVAFFNEMAEVANRISNRVRQELFVKELSATAGVSEDAVWPYIKKVTGHYQGSARKDAPTDFGQVTKAEKGLIWLLVHDPGPALQALRTLESVDLEALSSRTVLDLAKKLDEDSGFSPSTLLERLDTWELQLVTGVASEREPHVKDAAECADILRRMRYERDFIALQRDLDRLQGTATGDYGDEFTRLLERKRDLLQKIARLKFGGG